MISGKPKARNSFKTTEVPFVTINNLFRYSLLLFGIFTVLVAPVRGQSPNTAALIVVVVDQNGAVVPAAKVAVLNSATSDRRDAVSDGDGSITFSGLSLTGTYTCLLYTSPSPRDS